jgi:hypothetical protein
MPKKFLELSILQKLEIPNLNGDKLEEKMEK